ncbi:MAG: helix-turn-helix domain-containing protein, partial [Lactobacillus crispatus]|nr:helix-turn-helix domain-containing protein [Lactobacillus crispatus]
MINIQKFVQVRKKLKLSQTELCQGICTQSTLSKFENNGQVPSFKILKQLCERMD